MSEEVKELLERDKSQHEDVVNIEPKSKCGVCGERKCATWQLCKTKDSGTSDQEQVQRAKIVERRGHANAKAGTLKHTIAI